MQLYISPSERRVTISCGGGGGGGQEVMKVKGSSNIPHHRNQQQQQQQQHRRCSYRSLLPTVLILGAILPFLFVRAAFLALHGASICSSTQCLGWRFGGSSDTSLEIVEEWRRAFLEAKVEDMDTEMVLGSVPLSFDDLIADMTSNHHQDIKALALKTKAMLLKMDYKVRLARHHELIYRQLASTGIPKSLHCLTLRLAEEYSMNAFARLPLPPAELVSHLTDRSLLHIALITDNILAAAVVVSSSLKSSPNPGNMVFHIITDKKTYAPMHSWFALNPSYPAVVEVKGLHQFDWPIHINTMILETIEEINRTFFVYHRFSRDYDVRQALEPLNPSKLSLLNYLRIHLPELFPELNKVVFLDDDVIIRRDLSPLWSIDLEGKVNGAVLTGEGIQQYCYGKTFGDYLNFSNPLVSSMVQDQCVWLDGLNVFDLQAWRKTNITQAYLQLLILNRESGFSLWPLGSLPPALVAFQGQVHPIEPLWHLSGLGHQLPEDDELLETAAVLHFSGPAKPWLEIGFPKLRDVWRGHVNRSDENIRSCRIMD